MTARHVLQSLWKFGLGGPELRRTLLRGLARRFRSCSDEKNCTLIRYDILVGMRALFRATGDQAVKVAAAKLMLIEVDEKYRKKYAGAWRGVALT